MSKKSYQHSGQMTLAIFPGDIIRKFFLAGEIADLTAQITELNGYTTQEKADKAVKN